MLATRKTPCICTSRLARCGREYRIHESRTLRSDGLRRPCASTRSVFTAEGHCGSDDTMKKSQYRQWLKSQEWCMMRNEALSVAGYKCQLCSSSHLLNVHHNNYERVGGGELPSDLVVLCHDCHSWFHKNRKVRKPSPRARLHVQRMQYWKRMKEEKKLRIQRNMESAGVRI